MPRIEGVSAPLPPLPGPDDAPLTGRATSVLEREEVREELEPGDHERYAHYVRKEKILQSAMSGRPVVALCGKVWVPGRDPSRFPVCPVCKEIYQGLRRPQDGDGAGGAGGGDSGGGSGSAGSGGRHGLFGGRGSGGRGLAGPSAARPGPAGSSTGGR
ncbi:MAG: DUF3039 domain-containing protein [Micrococcales bacterium]|nr:DUF3039 domain-containing protein [Micrococcales bacterium]